MNIYPPQISPRNNKNIRMYINLKYYRERINFPTRTGMYLRIVSTLGDYYNGQQSFTPVFQQCVSFPSRKVRRFESGLTWLVRESREPIAHLATTRWTRLHSTHVLTRVRVDAGPDRQMSSPQSRERSGVASRAINFTRVPRPLHLHVRLAVTLN